MFKNLSNFGYQRSALEALGFYVAYLLCFGLCGGLLAGIAGVAFGASPEQGFQIGSISAIFFALILSIQVSRAKGIMKDYRTFIVILLSGFLAVFIGGLGGLIPIAYLTTIESHR